MPPSNRVLFQAYAPTSGTELWVSDGTTANTTLLKDIQTGTKGTSAPSGFTQFGSKVLFAATDVTHGTELWVTNGLPAGTYMLKDINPGATSGFVTHPNGTSDLTSLRAVGNVMVFLGNDGTTGQELWVTDGTSAGTTLLKDINSGSQPSNAVFMASFGDKLLFQASDGVHLTANDGLTGQELWVTDGTAAGTHVLADLDPGLFESGVPKNIADLGTGKAVFSAAVGNAGRELWVTDGTSGGTSLIKDINPGAYKGSNPSKAVPVGTTGLAVFAVIGSTNHANKSGGTQGTELTGDDASRGFGGATSRLIGPIFQLPNRPDVRMT